MNQFPSMIIFFANLGLCIESVAPNKCLIVTTQNNLPEVQAWIYVNLEQLICKLIPAGINLPPSLLLQCLDKPVYLATSHTYAKIFEKQFSLAATPTTPTTATNCLPCKWQAMLIEYASDGVPASPAHAVASTISQSTVAPSLLLLATAAKYVAELLSLKTEIISLCNIITSAVAEIISALMSLPINCTPLPKVHEHQ